MRGIICISRWARSTRDAALDGRRTCAAPCWVFEAHGSCFLKAQRLGVFQVVPTTRLQGGASVHPWATLERHAPRHQDTVGKWLHLVLRQNTGGHKPSSTADCLRAEVTAHTCRGAGDKKQPCALDIVVCVCVLVVCGLEVVLVVGVWVVQTALRRTTQNFTLFLRHPENSKRAH